MVTKRYQVQRHRQLNPEDLGELPTQLRDNLTQYEQVLALELIQTKGIPSHSLAGQLQGYRALEIDWGQISYRLVYRVYKKPAPRRVLILSFAEHDAAYEKATQRKQKKFMLYTVAD
ncbi:MAG: hypothetical protein GC158_04255 [Cyanobacteria bacterium RI_101]|nr:hypothetical protein [Cyanobacteria bacterium RI_101]